MHRSLALGLVAGLFLACGGGEDAPPSDGPAGLLPPPDLADSFDKGLLVSLSTFEVTDEGKVLPNPQPARLEILVRQGGEWKSKGLDDPESNVFHKAMVFDPTGSAPGILTLGGMTAAVKLWRKGDLGLQSQTLWSKDFGGKFSRMRDAEAADLDDDGDLDLAVATHDQGVVAVIRSDGGRYQVSEIDAEPNTFVHEIEIGDVDGDGTLEIYATPSEPNRLDGTPQSGRVTRYAPSGGGAELAADLGTRHAKEILVADVDGDGTDELYVAVEGESGRQGGARVLVHPVEIRRYEAGTDPTGGAVIATLEDQLCRFLTVGDVDGDGKKEMVAAAFRAGIWLLRPGSDPNAPWDATLVDKESSGFEHAALLTDLDGDGKDELYVASDDQGELRRYDFTDAGVAKSVLFSRPVRGSAFTWNLMPVPVEVVP